MPASEAAVGVNAPPKAPRHHPYPAAQRPSLQHPPSRPGTPHVPPRPISPRSATLPTKPSGDYRPSTPSRLNPASAHAPPATPLMPGSAPPHTTHFTTIPTHVLYTPQPGFATAPPTYMGVAALPPAMTALGHGTALPPPSRSGTPVFASSFPPGLHPQATPIPAHALPQVVPQPFTSEIPPGTPSAYGHATSSQPPVQMPPDPHGVCHQAYAMLLQLHHQAVHQLSQEQARSQALQTDLERYGPALQQAQAANKEWEGVVRGLRTDLSKAHAEGASAQGLAEKDQRIQQLETERESQKLRYKELSETATKKLQKAASDVKQQLESVRQLQGRLLQSDARVKTTCDARDSSQAELQRVTAAKAVSDSKLADVTRKVAAKRISTSGQKQKRKFVHQQKELRQLRIEHQRLASKVKRQAARPSATDRYASYIDSRTKISELEQAQHAREAEIRDLKAQQFASKLSVAKSVGCVLERDQRIRVLEGALASAIEAGYVRQIPATTMTSGPSGPADTAQWQQCVESLQREAAEMRGAMIGPSGQAVMSNTGESVSREVYEAEKQEKERVEVELSHALDTIKREKYKHETKQNRREMTLIQSTLATDVIRIDVDSSSPATPVTTPEAAGSGNGDGKTDACGSKLDVAVDHRLVFFADSRHMDTLRSGTLELMGWVDAVLDSDAMAGRPLADKQAHRAFAKLRHTMGDVSHSLAAIYNVSPKECKSLNA